ncbi:hypothetical protein [Stratiformator vulcanicus]|uniref:Ycf48-like protein n=1 Tax=Stratiformator vulcanicus TaxID=2527980 RepID=A0A517R5E1_9PLAN|nr:hypothetical protein [Stratiformator vulcanicus]QDT39117.1 hypothetical protein Pan189_35190 [Stratiformator vulcanicus]
MIIAYGDNGLRMTSSNGETWSKPEFWKQPQGITSATYGQGSYLLLAGTGYKGAGILTASRNGRDWSDTVKVDGKPSPKPYTIGFGADKFVILGGEAGSPNKTTTVMTSDNGKDWSKVTEEKEDTLLSVIYGNGQFVAIGVRGRVAVSKDGETWKSAPDRRALDSFISIAAGDKGYVGGGLHGLRMFSPDGLKWTAREEGLEGEHVNSMCWTGSEFVAVGFGATFRSSNGLSWDRTENADAPLRCVYHDGKFVGSAWRGRILMSDDAVKWREVHKVDKHVNGFITDQSA